MNTTTNYFMRGGVIDQRTGIMTLREKIADLSCEDKYKIGLELADLILDLIIKESIMPIRDRLDDIIFEEVDKLKGYTPSP